MTRRVVTLALIALAAACADRQPSGNSGSNETAGLAAEHQRLLDYLETPLYREPTRVRGFVTLGFETSAIDICDNPEGRCVPHRNVDGSNQQCWLDFADSAARDLPQPVPDGNYQVLLTGRIAAQPGMFGHLNQYSCQVEAITIHEWREAGLLGDDEPPGRDLVLSGRK